MMDLIGKGYSVAHVFVRIAPNIYQEGRLRPSYKQRKGVITTKVRGGGFALHTSPIMLRRVADFQQSKIIVLDFDKNTNSPTFLVDKNAELKKLTGLDFTFFHESFSSNSAFRKYQCFIIFDEFFQLEELKNGIKLSSV
jgi:hypothetical protein